METNFSSQKKKKKKKIFKPTAQSDNPDVRVCYSEKVYATSLQE